MYQPYIFLEGEDRLTEKMTWKDSFAWEGKEGKVTVQKNKIHD